jgi:hypothetical protein
LGKETVADVVERLMLDRTLKLGVIDTPMSGQLAREIIETGFSDLIATNLGCGIYLEPATIGHAGLQAGSWLIKGIASFKEKACLPCYFF